MRRNIDTCAPLASALNQILIGTISTIATITTTMHEMTIVKVAHKGNNNIEFVIFSLFKPFSDNNGIIFDFNHFDVCTVLYVRISRYDIV